MIRRVAVRVVGRPGHEGGEWQIALFKQR